jgi:subtilase family serine protease
VAIVDAYDDPNAESDLASYRSSFGLSPCTTSNGCFRKVNQNGGTSYPAPDSGWTQEISLDLDMVSAICPNCHILLVEASSNSFDDLGAAVNEAATLGANAISNSYGGSEWSNEDYYGATYYNHPGIAVTVSSGDNGYGVEFPAASQYVTAVGGTSLNQVGNTGTRNATETVWSGAGSGCSAYVAKPSWQTDSGCAKRTVADVAAVADPNTGVWVYDTYQASGWYIFGGTSVASPIVASIYALAGNGPSSASLNRDPYNDPAALNDVTSGSNGSCSPAYLCTGQAGYDGPSGLGTPNGTAAFGSGSAAPPPPAPVSAASSTVGASPTSVPADGSTTATITVTLRDTNNNPVGGKSVTLSAASGSSNISPGSGTTNGSGVVTFAVKDSTAEAVTYTATDTTDSPSVTVNQTATVSFTTPAAPADFSLAASPSSLTLHRYSSGAYTVTVTTPSGASNSSVNLSVSGLPSGASASFSPDSVTSSPSGATSTLTIHSGWTRGTYPLTITGTGGGRTHTTRVTLTIIR